MKILLTIWILIKHRYGVMRGWIGNVQDELNYVKKYIKEPTWEALREKGLEYKKDFIDSQYDSRTAFRKGYDDCDGFNRIAQCFWHNKGYEAYLISYIAKPFSKSHTTCILKVGELYIDCDYGFYGSGYYGFENCLDYIAEKNESKVRAYIIQGINWEIVNIRNL